jgi:hypothetical protein
MEYCAICRKIINDHEPVTYNHADEFVHVSCLSGTERSGAAQRCLPSATGSSDARAADEAGADSSVVRLTEAVRREDETPAACPFCGLPPIIETRSVHDSTDRKLYWIVCNTYGCGVAFTHGEWRLSEAIRHWNTRRFAGDLKSFTAPTLPRSGERASQTNETR